MKADWLTESLVSEIMENLSDARKPDHYQQFVTNCLNLFSIGREFANYRQLEQYIKLFLEGWKISKHRDGNTFKCFYSAPKKERKPKLYLKKNIRKAGKTLLIKPNEGVEIEESWFSDLVGLVSTTKTAKTGSYFLTFDNVGNSLDSLKSLRKNCQ